MEITMVVGMAALSAASFFFVAAISA